MGRIKVLDQELINQIAAGEVIERPSSVVKELLENAIDAGADSISVDIDGSGIDLIRIADNGHGMTGEEMDMAILRHATSKIATSDDLFSIRTLGFRGEALPSILSVSRTNVASRNRDSQSGTFLALEAGSVQERGMKGMPAGTVIEVRDLFFNTPARRKFLKTVATEQRHVIDIMSRYGLAYPSVRFSLTVNGRQVLNLRQNSGLEDRVVQLWGKEVSGKLIALPGDYPGPLSISGVLVSPEITRPGRNAVYTYVNSRSVLDNTLRTAVIEGYSGLIMKQRYPLSVLFIGIDPSEVDVNVHPAKAEVRFRNPSAVFGAIVGTVRKALGSARHCPVSIPGGPVEPGVSENSFDYRQGNAIPQAPGTGRRTYPDLQPRLFTQDLFTGNRTQLRYADMIFAGVFLSTYILLEHDSSLYILDQHAAHERVTYERLKAGRLASYPVQALISPLIIELSPVEFRAFDDIAGAVRDLGIEAEVFGESAIAVRSVPSELENGDITAILREFIAAVIAGDLRNKDYRQDLLVRVACHASVKAGRRLHDSEIAALLRDLDDVGSPMTCPHGRPLFKRIGRDEIERWIGRRP